LRLTRPAAETKLSANRQMGLTGCKYIFRQSPWFSCQHWGLYCWRLKQTKLYGKFCHSPR